MALKDLFVYVDQSDGALARLRLAADLARRNASQLTALYVTGRSPAHQYNLDVELRCLDGPQETIGHWTGPGICSK